MDPNIRIGDAERDEAARRLGEHHGAGRLSIDEFDERMNLAMEARTAGDLQALFTDLPGDPFDDPTPAPAPAKLPPTGGPVQYVEAAPPSKPFHASGWLVWGLLILTAATGGRLWPILAGVGIWAWVIYPMMAERQRAAGAVERHAYRPGDIESEIRAYLRADRKVEAIKRWRELHPDTGLAEAKAAVDQIERGM